MRKLRYALLASCLLPVPSFAQSVLMVPPLVNQPLTSQEIPAQKAVLNPLPSKDPVSDGPQQPEAPARPAIPKGNPPALDPLAPNKPLNNKAKAGLATAQRWISKFQKPHVDGDGVEHFLAGKGQVFVVAGVERITDIALSPGELIVPPLHIGDADEWKMHPAQSGSGNKEISHILIKPDDAGLSTNLVIETNKRTISVELVSRRADYMPMVALDMSEDDGNEWAAAAASVGAVLSDGRSGGVRDASPCDQMPTIPPAQFHISNANVPWRPLQVYVVTTPVGDKTCVDFAGDIGSSELPAMLALADDGGWFSGPTKKVINVRYLHRRFIADGRLGSFILVDGVGGEQKSVKVTRVQP